MPPKKKNLPTKEVCCVCCQVIAQIVQTPRDNTPLSHNAPPFVPENSTVVSQSPPETSVTDPISSFAQLNVMNTSAQSQLPSHTLPPPVTDNDSV